MEWDDYLEQGGTLLGDGAGALGDAGGAWGDLAGGVGDLAAGVGKLVPSDGESDLGGLGDLVSGGAGVLKGGSELAGKALSEETGEVLGAIGGGAQMVSALFEAGQHTDEMDGSWMGNDYWASMGDAQSGLVHGFLSATGNGAADKMLSAAELAVDATGTASAAALGDEYGFGAGDVMGAMQRGNDASHISPLLNVMNPLNPLAAMSSISRMGQADSLTDVLVGQQIQDGVNRCAELELPSLPSLPSLGELGERFTVPSLGFGDHWVN